jgi:DNA repair exonuclease SbcCD ATPase subunit
MDPEVEARFARSEASFNLRMDRAEERATKADERAEKADQRMDRFERRMELADKRKDARWKKTQERWKRDDERWDKFDKRLQATRKLVEAGMKIVMRMNSRLDEVAKSQKLILKTLQGGRNGHGSNGATDLRFRRSLPIAPPRRRSALALESNCRR